jgi:hypothetical protein
MRKGRMWGGNVEIIAITEIYGAAKFHFVSEGQSTVKCLYLCYLTILLWCY